MTRVKQRGADIKIVGTKSQINNLLAAFSANGFAWRSNEYFYPRIGQQGFFSYYLENLECVPQLEGEYKHLSKE